MLICPVNILYKDSWVRVRIMEARQGRRVEYCDLLYLYMDGKYMAHLPPFPTPGPMIDITNQFHHSIPLSLVAALALLSNCPCE